MSERVCCENRITYPINCKNCGTPLHGSRCEFCGTEYPVNIAYDNKVTINYKENSDSKLIPKNTGKWEIPEPTDEQRAKWLEAMKQIADENGRVTLGGLSDGSLIGEFECFYILGAIGCTDIKTESRPATADEIPKDRPFLRWHFQVSGNLPKENKQI